MGLGALALTVIAASCGRPAPAAEPSTSSGGGTPVRIVEATASSRGALLRTSGTVASRSESELTFKTAGYVAEVRVEEGDRVVEGQVLARLQMTEVDARLRAAEARADVAEKQFRRMERLFADSVVPAVQLEQARSAYEGAQAELEVARFDHAYATIRAPSDGRILIRSVEVAEFTTPGASAFRFGSTSEGWIVRVHVADHQVVRITPGAPARVVVPGLDSQGVPGRVVEVADAADPRSGTFEVEVEVDLEIEAGGAETRLRSGMIAEVELELEDDGSRVTLPLHAVVDAQGRTGAVFVVQGDRAVRREVRIVEIGADGVGVEGRDLVGARVVTAGAAYLRDGDLIAPVSPF
jgi:RND family efflux transporter MFP subunit